MTIAKNTKRAKDAIKNACDIRCYSLSNNFSGEPLAVEPVVWGGEIINNQFTKLVPVTQSEFLRRELALNHSKLTIEGDKYTLHVHDNLWYTFTFDRGEVRWQNCIIDRPSGYFMDCLLACLAEQHDGHITKESKYVEQVADTVLARAQRPDALPVNQYSTRVWNAAFDTLAHARAQCYGWDTVSEVRL